MSDSDPVDTAWRIHGALADWTGKVDAKASFALTIESAVIAGVVALAATGRRFAQLHHIWVTVLLSVGLTLMLGAVLFAGSVVLPRTRRKDVQGEWSRNFIYFGHVKFWDPHELETALKSRDVLPVLSRQLVNMGKIAWKKHYRVQVSLWLGFTATALLISAFVGN